MWQRTGMKERCSVTQSFSLTRSLDGIPSDDLASEELSVTDNLAFIPVCHHELVPQAGHCFENWTKHQFTDILCVFLRFGYDFCQFYQNTRYIAISSHSVTDTYCVSLFSPTFLPFACSPSPSSWIVSTSSLPLLLFPSSSSSPNHPTSAVHSSNFSLFSSPQRCLQAFVGRLRCGHS